MKVAFLGQGDFAAPIHQQLKKTFGLVTLGQAEVLVVASWGEILNHHIINQPKFGALNIHPSLLPKYRGASPIQAAILNGDRQTGITIIKMDELVDHGPIVYQKTLSIAPNDTRQSLTDRLAVLGAQLITEIIPRYISGSIQPISQDHARASYAPRIVKSAGLIKLSDSPEINLRKIRAYWPWPGAWLAIKDKKLFIHQAHVQDDRLAPDLVQLEGRKKMDWTQFRLGWRDSLPEQLLVGD